MNGPRLHFRRGGRASLHFAHLGERPGQDLAGLAPSGPAWVQGRGGPVLAGLHLGIGAGHKGILRRARLNLSWVRVRRLSQKPRAFRGLFYRHPHHPPDSPSGGRVTVKRMRAKGRNRDSSTDPEMG